MKSYNIKPENGKFTWGEMMVVRLGESGRGRKEVYIPFHAKEEDVLLEIGETKTGKPKIVSSIKEIKPSNI